MKKKIFEYASGRYAGRDRSSAEYSNHYKGIKAAQSTWRKNY